MVKNLSLEKVLGGQDMIFFTRISIGVYQEWQDIIGSWQIGEVCARKARVSSGSKEGIVLFRDHLQPPMIVMGKAT